MSLLLPLRLSAILQLFITSSLTRAQDTSTLVLTTTLEPTTTTSIVSILPPIPVPSSNNYTLIGCYNEVSLGGGNRAVGNASEYLTPFVIPETMTTPLCLAACSSSSSTNGSGNYTYAALENSSECYCGTSLSNSSSKVDPLSCVSPCAGDNSTSCGGVGFLSLYQLTSTIPRSPKRTRSASNIGIWIGISLGLFFLILLIVLALWYENQYYNRHHRTSTGPPAESAHTGRLATLPFFTFTKPKHESSPGYLYQTYEPPIGKSVPDTGYTPPQNLSEHKKGPERIKSLEAWKSGTVLPLPSLAPSTLPPVCLGDTLSDEPYTSEQSASASNPTPNVSRQGSVQQSWRPDYESQRSFGDVAFANIGEVIEDKRRRTLRMVNGKDPKTSWLDGNGEEIANRENPRTSWLESNGKDNSNPRNSKTSWLVGTGEGGTNPPVIYKPYSKPIDESPTLPPDSPSISPLASPTFLNLNDELPSRRQISAISNAASPTFLNLNDELPPRRHSSAVSNISDNDVLRPRNSAISNVSRDSVVTNISRTSTIRNSRFKEEDVS